MIPRGKDYFEPDEEPHWRNKRSHHNRGKHFDTSSSDEDEPHMRWLADSVDHMNIDQRCYTFSCVGILTAVIYCGCAVLFIVTGSLGVGAARTMVGHRQSGLVRSLKFHACCHIFVCGNGNTEIDRTLFKFNQWKISLMLFWSKLEHFALKILASDNDLKYIFSSIICFVEKSKAYLWNLCLILFRKLDTSSWTSWTSLDSHHASSSLDWPSLSLLQSSW